MPTHKAARKAGAVTAHSGLRRQSEVISKDPDPLAASEMLGVCAPASKIESARFRAVQKDAGVAPSVRFKTSVGSARQMGQARTGTDTTAGQTFKSTAARDAITSGSAPVP